MSYSRCGLGKHQPRSWSKLDARAAQDARERKEQHLGILDETRKQMLAQDPDNLELRRTHGTLASYIKFLNARYPENRVEIPEAELSRFEGRREMGE